MHFHHHAFVVIFTPHIHPSCFIIILQVFWDPGKIIVPPESFFSCKQCDVFLTDHIFSTSFMALNYNFWQTLILDTWIFLQISLLDKQFPKLLTVNNSLFFPPCLLEHGKILLIIFWVNKVLYEDVMISRNLCLISGKWEVTELI